MPNSSSAPHRLVSNTQPHPKKPVYLLQNEANVITIIHSLDMPQDNQRNYHILITYWCICCSTGISSPGDPSLTRPHTEPVESRQTVPTCAYAQIVRRSSCLLQTNFLSSSIQQSYHRLKLKRLQSRVLLSDFPCCCFFNIFSINA